LEVQAKSLQQVERLLRTPLVESTTSRTASHQRELLRYRKFLMVRLLIFGLFLVVVVVVRTDQQVAVVVAQKPLRVLP
jgi:hypothetical protein